MEQKILDEKERLIFQKYQDTIAPYIMELEVRDGEYPTEILNEIRAVFTHLARYNLQGNENDLNSAEGHIERATLDCFKYLCVSMAENISRFRKEYKKVDLKLADNGRFLPQLDKLENEAREAFKEAKKSEITKEKSIDEQYVLFEKAYNAYSTLDSFLISSNEAILFASHHSKSANIITVVSCIVTIISIVVTIIVTVS